jgi:predicted ATPase/DNA-binding winged helix-turn-helix (wHTH) protein
MRFAIATRIFNDLFAFGVDLPQHGVGTRLQRDRRKSDSAVRSIGDSRNREMGAQMTHAENVYAEDTFCFGPFVLRAAERLLEKAGVPVHLGTRALDILVVLVNRAGQIVSKNDLLELAWPDVTVDEGSLRFHMVALRKALGEGLRGHEFVKTLRGQGYCFVAPVSRGHAPGFKVVDGSVFGKDGKLPARLTRMVGRDGAIEEISGRLAADRFVSIIGPGGIGKTAVAVSVGHRIFSEFGGAVSFLNLGPLDDRLLVPGAVASALGVQVEANDPIPGLIDFLRDERILLIFDNCEHVIDTVATLAERIFQEVPQVHILATSREALRVEGEHVLRLPPLEAPPDDPGLTAAQALRYPAVQLFVERMAASGQRCEVSDADAPVIGGICRRLDGIALAIELVASRVGAYGIRETAAFLDDRPWFLWKGRRTALLRHQSLGAALDWSYDLLPVFERAVLHRLTAFTGEFTLQAAESVAAEDDIDGKQVVVAVANLVAKSLAAADTSGPTTRYRLFDTTRAYVLARLAGSGGDGGSSRRRAFRRAAVPSRADAA